MATTPKRGSLQPKDDVICSVDLISTGKISDYYIMGELLGKGAFSEVFEAVDKKTKEKYAVKAVKKKFIKKKLLEREIEIMTKIKHDNILNCKEVFENEEFIYLVLELVKGGELYDKIVDEGEFTEDEAKEIILQILDAVDYLHSNGIAHRDLKPENILCIETGGKKKKSKGPRIEQIKIADFGLSKMFSAEDLISQCGSPTYVAPEVLLCKKPYNEAVDMWAVGVITFVILTGCFPFFEDGKNYSALYQKIINVDYYFPEEPRLSPDAKNFIQKLLVREPEKRYVPSQCKAHPWLKATAEKRAKAQSVPISLQTPPSPSVRETPPTPSSPATPKKSRLGNFASSVKQKFI